MRRGTRRESPRATTRRMQNRLTAGHGRPLATELCQDSAAWSFVGRWLKGMAVGVGGQWSGNQCGKLGIVFQWLPDFSHHDAQ